MRHVERPPCLPLRPYAQLVWCLELDGPGDFGPPERIAPDGIVEMVFHYGDPMAMRYSGETFAAQPRSSIVSQTRRFVEIQPTGTTGLVSVRMRPWGAHQFLGVPVSEIADRQVAARDVWGPEALELEERLFEAVATEARIALVEGFLLWQLRRHQKESVEPVVRAVWARQGKARVGELCHALGLTERGLQRVFSRALGVSPKGFARLVRFQHACAQLRRGSWSSLTEVSLDCGYYDQAHFIGDFKALSGMTPGAFVRADNVSYLEPG